MKNLQASQFRDILEELNSLKGRHERLNERQEALYKMLGNMKGPPPEGNYFCLLYRKITVDLIENSKTQEVMQRDTCIRDTFTSNFDHLKMCF